MQATHRVTKHDYAIKVLDKGHLARNNKLQTALIEKNTLVRLGAGHPGIVKLHWTFQDEYSLCQFGNIRSKESCDCSRRVRLQFSFWTWQGMENCSRGYRRWDRSRWSARGITQLKSWMRWTICTGKASSTGQSGSNLLPCSRSAVERSDLKPENLLLDDSFRLKITDFGTGKILDSDGWSPNPIHPKT